MRRQVSKGKEAVRTLFIASALIALSAVAAQAIGTSPTPAGAASASGGEITLCVKKRGGAVRVVKSGKHCRHGERRTVINRTGPTGATGAPGSARAYALVKADASVPAANAKGIAATNVLHPSAGRYCVVGLPFAPSVVVASGSIAAGPVFIHASVAYEGISLGGCPSDSQILIDIYNSSFIGVDTPFYIVVE